MFFMFSISYLCKEKWEGRDKIISMMSFKPNPCTSDFNRTYCSWDRYFLLILQMTPWTQSGILLSDPLRGDLNLSALVCLPGLAIWLSCPCCKVVWMHVRPCSQQGFVLAYWCWHPSILLPTSPQLDGWAFWHILVGFLWKCPSAEAVWTEEYPTGQPFLLAFAFWVEGTAFGIKLSTFIQGVFCPRPVIKPFSFGWFIADLELFSLWVYARVLPFKEFLQQCRCHEFERDAWSWWVSRSEKQVLFSTEVPSFQCRVYYLCPSTRFSNRVNWGYNCLC